MTLARLRTTALIALPLVAAAVFTPVAASAAPAPGAPVLLGSGVQVPLLAGDTNTSTYVADPAELDPARAGAVTATFKVTYHGFSPAAKASFQRAVNTWAHTVHSSVPIVIDATYKALPARVLGQAGSNKYWLVNNRIAGDALANKLVKKQIDPSPDIIATFSSSFNNWYFGTGNSPANTYDFQSVVTHEIGHGLGFLGSGYVANGKATIGSQGKFFSYDVGVKTGAGKPITSFANGSAALKSALTSNNLYFSSAAVHKAKIYAPKTFQPGSSYSHLDEATYKAGNPNSLMTPILNPGESIHSPGPIMLGVFKTIGW